MEKKLQLKKISCSNCGAELMYDPGTQMTNCNFCGSKFEIEKATDEELILPDGIIPFKVTKDEYHQAVLAWLSEGDYTPDDILTSSVFDQINGVYLPMYFYKGRYHGNWSASSGYDKRVQYTEWSDSQKKMVKKTKTVTDWRPSSGQVAGTFSILGFAGSGEGIKPEIAAYAHDTSFNREDLKKYDSKYTLGFNLLEFTSGEEDVWDTFGKTQADSIANADIKNRIPGDRYKDLTADVLYDREEAIRVYVPYWVVYYKYAEKEFHVCMDGTTASRISGERPEDKSRKYKVAQFFLPSHITLGVWLVIWLIFAFNESEGIAGPVFGIGLVVVIVLYIISNLRKNALIKQSKLRRQEILKTMSTTEVEQEELTKETK
jgi:hypothetical protein